MAHGTQRRQVLVEASLILLLTLLGVLSIIATAGGVSRW